MPVPWARGVLAVRRVRQTLVVGLALLVLLVLFVTLGGSSSGPAKAAGSFAVVYRDDFTSGTLDRRWSAYTGTPSSDPWTRWDGSRVRVSDGALELSGVPDPSRPGHWLTGGVSNWRDAQTYGRWTIRFSAAPSSVLSHHFLLWPKAERWPPEIDIAESWSATRSSLDGFVHYPGSGGKADKVGKRVSADFTEPHTVAVTWTPSSLVYTLDGDVWWEVTGSAVPSEPMWLALQSETQICDRSRSACTGDSRTATPTVLIDWVQVESYTP